MPITKSCEEPEKFGEVCGISAWATKEVSPGHNMSTEAWLNTETGYVMAYTHTWCMHWIVGFTGAVGLLLWDADGAPLFRSQTVAFGVDARGVPFKASSRVDTWDMDIDPEIAQQVALIAPAHTSAPRERLDEWIQWVINNRARVERIREELPELFAAF